LKEPICLLGLGKRWITPRHGKEGDSDGKDISFETIIRGLLGTISDLRGLVSFGPDLICKFGVSCLFNSAHAKISQFYGEIRPEQDVVRLDIPMSDPERVEMRHPVQKLSEIVPEQPAFHPPSLHEVVYQRAMLSKFKNKNSHCFPLNYDLVVFLGLINWPFFVVFVHLD
jgi:hypothetical protein